jgi:hypothetical protein
VADVRAARDERREHFGWWTRISSRWSDWDAHYVDALTRKGVALTAWQKAAIVDLVN